MITVYNLNQQIMQITDRGLQDIVKRLSHLDNLGGVLDVPMEQSLTMLHADIAPYPPQAVPLEVYRRTGTLGRLWTSKVKTSRAGAVGTLGNKTPYAIYVQGDKQRDFHERAGWVRADKQMEKRENDILAFFKKAVDRALR